MPTCMSNKDGGRFVTSEDVAERLARRELDFLRLVRRHAKEALRSRIQGLRLRVAKAGVPHRRRSLEHHLLCARTG